MARIVARGRACPKHVHPGAAAFRRRLLSWYGRHQRRLPWRGVRDPYAVLVSEIMLQQTQVARVTEFYPRFLARYPTLEDLAAASPGAVRESWDGLGYYARARNLHAAARHVVHAGTGRLPDTVEELRKLPGIGRYTAGAVASLAFNADVPAVDTNAARVLARVFGLRGKPKTARHEHRVWTIAAALVPRNRSADWNQALMDLGATYCTARSPRCKACPVRSGCKYLRRRTG
ncbi:MAG TPA: A/G-specific adenine glycosylase [Candidatus Binatia bacterium]|nr:A/G-specific adenine glycosylase [Candidatus Binatia bacterium]